MNLLIAIGRIGQDAIQKPVGDQFVTNFSIAIPEKVNRDTAEVIKPAMWVSVAYWTKKPTKLVDYLLKGEQVCIKGETSVRTYKNNQGATIAQLEVVAESVELLGNKKETAQAAPAPQPEAVETESKKK